MGKNTFVAIGVLREVKFDNDWNKTVNMWVDGTKTNTMIDITTARGKVSLDCGESGHLDFDVQIDDYSMFQKKGKKPEVSSSYDNFRKFEERVKSGEVVPASKGGEVAVKITGSITSNIYYSDKVNRTIEVNNLSVAYISVLPVVNPETFGCSATVTCFIKDKHPEVKNDEETGRINVSAIASPRYGSKLFPLFSNSSDKFIHVGADLADDFDEMLEECGRGCYDLNIDIVSKSVVKAKPAPSGGRSFGGKTRISTETSTYAVKELMIVGGTFVEPIIEENEDGEEVLKNPYDCITLTAAKNGMKAYNEKVANAESDWRERQKKNKNAKSKASTAQFDDLDVGDMPF